MYHWNVRHCTGRTVNAHIFMTKRGDSLEEHTTQDSVVKWKIYSHRKNISSNHLFTNFLSKNIAFTKVLPKMHESKFPKLPHCGTGSMHWSFLPSRFSVKLISVILETEIANSTFLEALSYHFDKFSSILEGWSLK